MTEATITTRLNGPLLVKGPVKLIDHEGREYDLSGKETYALCRCGATNRRPFCDGTHKTCGWVSSEVVPPPVALSADASSTPAPTPPSAS